MPIIDKYREMGTFIMGKVEAGEAKKGQVLLLMPNRVSDRTVTYVCKNAKIRNKTINRIIICTDNCNGRSVLL